jgi:hypothetical protein
MWKWLRRGRRERQRRQKDSRLSAALPNWRAQGTSG